MSDERLCAFVIPSQKKGAPAKARLLGRFTKAKRCGKPATREIDGAWYCPHHHPKLTGLDPFYQTVAWRTARARVLARDNHVCRYCGRHAEQADHVLARCRGGTEAMSNLVASCARCNKLAGGRMFNGLADKQRWIRKEIIR